MRVARKPKLCGSCNSEHRGYISDTLHFVRLRLQVLKAEEKVILLEIDKEGFDPDVIGNEDRADG